jgi:hypothetical protein
MECQGTVVKAGFAGIVCDSGYLGHTGSGTCSKQALQKLFL